MSAGVTVMNDFPDFSEQGYQVIRELGCNYVGGRITYLATDSRTQQPVVIKQFQFAKFSSNWSGFKAFEREIQVLQGLNHPGIPRYLNSFETPDGFCMVQEYKNAQPLSVPRSFDADEIKQIAVSILEILVYLQNRIPSVIHRDIKPENILVDEQLNVYLVDFGFAKIGGEEVAMSSVALGTLGFMPPEQLYNRQLTEATDLYSLGMTLICLLTGTKSTAIDTLIDEDNRVNFKHLVSKLSLRWIDWLEKLVQPNQKNRYATATAALEALKPIYVIRVPEVQLSQSSLEFKASKLGERLTQTITVNNPIPETILEGRWEVAPHPSDPPHTPETHAWIKFAPAKFASNQATCRITVDTSQLMADKTYERKILLHANSAIETYSLTIQVQTSAIPIATRKPPYWFLTLLGGAFFSLGLLVSQILPFLISSPVISAILMLIVLSGAWDEAERGGIAENAFNHFPPLPEFKFPIGLGEILVCLFFWQIILVGILLIMSFYAFLLIIFTLIFIGAFIVSRVKYVAAEIENKGFRKVAAVVLLILTIGLGTSLGIWFKLGASNILALAAVLGTGLPLAGMLFYPHLERGQLIARYRKSEQHLIKP
jgi:serine/threonine protein kinase